MPRIVPPLTNTQIDRAKPTEKEYSLADGNGLSLRVKPTSSKIRASKTWILNYTSPATKKRTNLTLGTYPEITLAQARAKREEYRALLAQGIDPQMHRALQEEKAQLQHLNSFKAMAELWREKRQHEVEAETMKKNWERMEKHLFPFIGSVNIEDIVPTLLVATLKPLDKAGKNDTLHRLISLTRQVLDFAVNRGILEYNKCGTVSKAFHKEPAKHHPAIKSDEVPQFLIDVKNSRMDFNTKHLLKWQFLTMVRSNEACRAQWAQIDFENAIWHIPAEQMKKTGGTRKPHSVPLCRQALAILAIMKPITGHSKYIFPHYSQANKSMEKNTIATALRRMGYKDKMDAHGMRTTARTYLSEQNVQFDHGEKCLSHATGNEVSRAYNRTDYLEQRKPIMQIWGDYVEHCAQQVGLAFP